MTGPAVLVMAKAPRPGLVKTRLAPLLGDDGCACLQATLILRATAVAQQVAPDATFVAFTPPDARAELRALLAGDEVLLAQRGANLGERLAHATGEILATRPAPLLVIGTDIPALKPRHLRQAFNCLREGADVVFGPAQDGGYYLAGLARPEPILFDLPAEVWGGPGVLSASLAVARSRGLSVEVIEALADLDTIDDAARLLDDPSLPRWLRRALTSSGGRFPACAGEP